MRTTGICRKLTSHDAESAGTLSFMCGRFLLLSSGPTIADLFQLAGVPEIAPRYNIAPTQQVLAVGLDKAGRRNVATFKWGLGLQS